MACPPIDLHRQPRGRSGDAHLRCRPGWRLTPARLVVFACLTILCQTGCSGRPADDARRLQLTGVVVELQAAPPRTVIAHDAVEGLMPAMEMPFEVRGPAPPTRVGDRIAATLVVSNSHSWLEDVRVTTRDDAVRVRVPVTSRAAVGDEVPDLPLLDQNGAPITLRGSGHIKVVTFIYTRCPLPDFCPLMVKHLEAVRQRVEDAALTSRVAFVGITLDPTFDTPEVLRAYGESVLGGADRFEHWTLATGTTRQVQDAARYFGVESRSEQGLVTHTLMTIVVSSQGRVVRVLPSNAWRPDDLFDAIRRTADRDTNP